MRPIEVVRTLALKPVPVPVPISIMCLQKLRDLHRLLTEKRLTMAFFHGAACAACFFQGDRRLCRVDCFLVDVGDVGDVGLVETGDTEREEEVDLQVGEESGELSGPLSSVSQS